MKRNERVMKESTIVILVVLTSVFLINSVVEKSEESFMKEEGELPPNINNPIIGAQRDTNGCLIPAGYSYNQNIEVCLRTWELSQQQKKAAKIAIEHLTPYYSLTITQIEQLICSGCFNVYLTDENFEDNLVSIINWEVAFDSELNK